MPLPFASQIIRRARLCHLPAALLTILCTIIALLGASPPAAATDRPASPIRIIAFGDSLTAGFRLAPADAFPIKLERFLKAKGLPVAIANAGVSGDTTAAGLERLDWAVPDGTDIVILELGANDALRGIDPATTRHNLDRLITRITAKGAAVLLAGMRAPRNYGSTFAKRFDAIFPALADKHKVMLYPFFLEGVALDPALNLDDGLHPNARGIDVIVRSIAPAIEQLIRTRTGKKQGSRG